MTQAQSRARHQEKVEALCAAAIRALSGDAALHFRGRRLHRGQRALPLFAAHLHPALETDDFSSFRGAADGLALRLAHSNAALHQSLQAQLNPAAPVQRMLFGLLEQFRAEALAPETMPGARRNLRHRFEAWSLALHHAGGTETARGLLLYTVAQVCRSRVSGEPVVEATEGLLEATRAALAPAIGSALAGLRRHRSEQAAYALHALHIVRTVAALLHPADGKASAEKRDAQALQNDAWAAFSLALEVGGDTNTSVATAVHGRSAVLEGSATGYRVYTTAYDRVAHATTLARAEVLGEYRAQIDQRVAGLGVNLAHLARDLKALFALPTREGWQSGQEEGQIDGRRLALLVGSPTERRLFRSENIESVAHSHVSLLIDCSGSMKEHIEAVAVLTNVLVRALEQAGVSSEVLGYTTKAWNGGRAQRDWQRAGRPAHPGRLNEACHLIFKTAATPWRRARNSMAALLKADLFKEGLDGEAVEWALRRMHSAAVPDSAQRRVLVVLSDGSPMDSATHLANDTHYLDHHLKDVVARLESEGAKIYGLGVGLDLSPYYRRSHVLNLSGGVSSVVFREIVGMLGRGGRR